MRVMVFAKANDGTNEAPTAEAFAAMDKFIEELVAAGIFVAAAGLKNDADAKRIVSGRGQHAVTDGPFTESKELIVGFSIWKVKDMDEAIAWAKRNPMPGELEIRPFYEAEDFADVMSPEERAAPREGDRGKLGVA